ANGIERVFPPPSASATTVFVVPKSSPSARAIAVLLLRHGSLNRDLAPNAKRALAPWKIESAPNGTGNAEWQSRNGYAVSCRVSAAISRSQVRKALIAGVIPRDLRRVSQ